ncbi:DUF3037 domain-containing protein [Hymenobacter sp. RP-2-7]|uniref:DUF3037 domain-containing protein n=1 Tax=Hymenobacter polaris TaxID=2682546 RepID=A0A7Y0ABZ8_9BACT|nr:DUF3037 domain-containing protein [Hymenobacter polaris]NML64280.1 DUF3037 domain-containing protein [Hymenobacter polaris]
MPAVHLFEYATLRLVPRLEREEFVNAGVILYCRDQRFLGCRWLLPTERLVALAGATGLDLPLAELQARLQAIERICTGGPAAGPIGQFGTAERFRWLTAQRSTSLQASPVHPGLCADALVTLEKLFAQLVL